MKFLIWFLCILANALITVFLKNTGVLLGAIPTVLLWLGTAWLARSLCKLFEEDRAEKDRHRIIMCTTCGYRSKDPFDACPKCGKYEKKYTYEFDIEYDEDKMMDTSEGKICFCRKCGEKLVENSTVCQTCGTIVVETNTGADIEQKQDNQ